MNDMMNAKGGRVFPGVLALVLASVLIGDNAMGVNKPSETEPNFTKGENTGERYAGKGCWNYFNLGPVGALGELWMDRNAFAGNPGGQQGRTTRVMKVLEGSPADGILKVNDVILGIGDSKFSSDVRKTIAAAIAEAEGNKADSGIVFMIYRPEGDPKDGKGKEMKVTVKIPVMGSYSDTAPWDCEKSKVIIDAACKSILDRGLFETQKDGKRVIKDSIPTNLEVLGLLATGEDKYLPVVKQYVRELGDPKQEIEERFNTWFISYKMLLLTEYYLATKDEYVLPVIGKTAKCIARGASDVGTFSHGPAYHFTAHGTEWKYPSSYGAMNQCSLTCAIALVLARKCGIRDDEVERVIEKQADFYRWYVDKGAIPYGDHPAWPNHDDNGKNSQAAVLFDLLGDKESTGYFSRATLGSYNIREMGHTGHFFSFQWGALGAARGGEEAAHSFVTNMQWYTELERRPDGGFKYQPQLSNIDHGKYLSWSTTGSRLLQYCLPRKKLYITGKGGSCAPPITGNDLDDAVAAGVFDPKELPIRELLNSLASHSPVVRRKAAEELGKRKEDVVEQMIAMLDSPDRRARYGACEGLRHAGRGSEAAIGALVKILETDNDLTMRYYAACAFRQQGTDTALVRIGKDGVVDKATRALMKQAAVYEPEVDPLRKLHAVISDTLFSKDGLLPRGKGVEKVDRTVLIPAIKSLLLNPNGRCRTNVSCVYERLTQDDLKQVWGDIYYATKYQAPSGSMEAGGVRGNGLKLMANDSIREGIPVGIDWALRQEGWGNADRKKSGVPSLLKYGSALKPFIPEMDSILAGWTSQNQSKNNQENAKDFKDKLYQALKNPVPTLNSIKPYIDATPDPLLKK